MISTPSSDDSVPISPSEQDLKRLHTQNDPAVILDRDYRILAANRAYKREYGADHSALGKRCFEVSHDYDRPCDQAGESCPLLNCIQSSRPERLTHVHHTPKGHAFVDVETIPLTSTERQEPLFLEIMRPVLMAHAVPSTHGMVGVSPAFTHMIDLVRRVAPEEVSVLLLGASGVGKELVARAVHETSGRHRHAFVPVECSGFPESLFESELFGHEKGAFTGALHEKAGLVEAAHKGTLFLDEVGDIPLHLQVKLLRLLETGTFRRVGETITRHTDFRLISATNRDLRRMVRKKRFREDLFYRISVFDIDLPPLKARREDIDILALSVLKRISTHHRLRLDASARKRLRSYPFPGNIRELQNLLEKAKVLSSGPVLSGAHFPDIPDPDALPTSPDASPPAEADPGHFTLDRLTSLKEVERAYLRHALSVFDGRREELAQLLGISTRTLNRKIVELKRKDANATS